MKEVQIFENMQVILFDTQAGRDALFPFTAVRPVADIRTGILSSRERWQMQLHTKADVLTENYLLEPVKESGETKLFIHAALFPSPDLMDAIVHLKTGEGIVHDDMVLAVHTDTALHYGFNTTDCGSIHFRQWQGDVRLLQHPFEMMQWNDEMIRHDYGLLTKNRLSQTIPATNQLINPESVFIEEGAKLDYCIINASAGPVYIGKNCLLMEGAMIRGPFAMLEGSVVKMGAKIYGATSLGRYCTAGGEIKNSVLFDYSNKAHDGYMGDAVIGSWCNLGAGTSCSNIKNNAGEIKTWNPLLHRWVDAGRKCGIIMGDYSRTAINTSLNTGTVTGICANIVYNGFPPKYIKPFTWNIETDEKYVTAKAIRDIDNWKQLKHQRITEKEMSIIEHLYQNQL